MKASEKLEGLRGRLLRYSWPELPVYRPEFEWLLRIAEAALEMGKCDHGEGLAPCIPCLSLVDAALTVETKGKESR